MMMISILRIGVRDWALVRQQPLFFIGEQNSNEIKIEPSHGTYGMYCTLPYYYFKKQWVWYGTFYGMNEWIC